jgi:hypothetical protein
VFSVRLARIIQHPSARQGIVVGKRPDELAAGDLLHTVADKSYSLSQLVAWDVHHGTHVDHADDATDYDTMLVIRAHTPYRQTNSVALFAEYLQDVQTSVDISSHLTFAHYLLPSAPSYAELNHNSVMNDTADILTTYVTDCS